MIEAPQKGAKKITNLILSFNINLQKKIIRAFLFKSNIAYLIFVVKFYLGFFLYYFQVFFGFCEIKKVSKIDEFDLIYTI